MLSTIQLFVGLLVVISVIAFVAVRLKVPASILLVLGGVALGLADGPTEAHKVNLARLLLKDYEAEDPEWPSEFLDNRIAAAREKYGDLVEHVPSIPT